MADYRFKLDENDRIILEAVTKAGKVTASVDATETTITAVRDMMIKLSRKAGVAQGYKWELENGNELIMMLEERTPENNKGE